MNFSKIGEIKKENLILKNENLEFKEELKKKDEKIRNSVIGLEKEKAMLEQKIKFLNLQFQEKNDQLEETKKSHEKIVQALHESKNVSNKNNFDEEAQIKHQSEIKKLEEEFEKIKKRFTKQNNIFIYFSLKNN